MTSSWLWSAAVAALFVSSAKGRTTMEIATDELVVIEETLLEVENKQLRELELALGGGGNGIVCF